MVQGLIDQLLASLKPYRYGWTVEIPEECGNLFGQAIALQFETQLTPEADPPPAINPEERQLASSILLGLKSVLAEVASRFSAYTHNDPDKQKAVRKPHIWISREIIEEDGPSRWDFVIGRVDSPDYGIHVEFDGLEHSDTWGGD